MQIRFPTVVGKYYQVEKSDQSDLHTWLVVATNLRGDGRSMEIDDPIDVGTVRWFYRVVLLP